MATMKQKSLMDKSIDAAKAEKYSIEDMPLTNIREYRLYNEEARKINHRLQTVRYAIKQCPEELHPSQRIAFQRNDQPTNDLLVHLSDEKIHYHKTLTPGKTYTLPECVINHISGKGYPIWGWVDNADGSRETKVVNKDPRFSLRTIYEE